MQPKELIEALIKVQSELKPVLKNQRADTGRYQYNYADLAQVLETAAPILSKNKLAVIQTIERNQTTGELELHTILAHSSGQNIISKAPLLLKEQTPQALGSAITYMRRYSLMAMVGMVAQDEDDDGAKATGLTLTQAPADAPQIQTVPNLAEGLVKKPLIRPSNPDIAEKIEAQKQPQPQTSLGPTAKQINRFFAIAKSRGWTELEASKLCESLTQKPIHMLSRKEYDHVCEYVTVNHPSKEPKPKDTNDIPPFDPNEPFPTDEDLPF